ncbi:MAG: M20 family metallopeptidase [Deltaproteobacteria bacterium]|nr:M20 family metallopeptidase [Deltaproteobacteria bacterium]
MTSLKKELIKTADGLRKKITDLSDNFYQNPELGLKEHKTSLAMQGFLTEHGFKVKAGIAGMETAFRATLGEGRPAVALLAEMDALPGIGHGCGHNIAGMASIGAAAALSVILKGNLSPGKGTLLVLGTPAEELGKGKIEMVKHNVFDEIDAAMMVHGSSKRTVIKHFLGLVRLNFVFHGHASHASAYPEEGINALDAVIQTFNSISALRQQLRPDVKVHGIITDGGKAPNIIPERAEASFYVRANDLAELASLKERVINCAKGAAVATGCRLEVREVGDLNAPMKINNAFAGVYRQALGFLELPEDLSPAERNVGSSDVGNVSQTVPAIHPHVPIREGINIHTREFADSTVTPDGHRALMEGVICLGLTAVDLLFDPDLLLKVKRDFNRPPEDAH